MFNRLLRPAADSVTCQRNKDGDVPYAVMLNLIWAFWFFGDLMYGTPPSMLWIVVTAVGFCAVVALWVLAMTRSARLLMRYTMAMALLGYLVLPVNHSGGSCCFIYSCALLAHQGTVRSSLTMMALVASIYVIETIWLGWPWAIIISMLSITLAVGGGNLARRANEKKNAEIRLSHEEVRRLAGLAERERIGRDLHDLLGHTLSLITLKTELANKLFDRDAAAAKREMIDVERVARDALAQVRRAVTGIRAAGFAAELASAKLLLESNGVNLTYTLADVALPVEIETVLAMAVREAVTNIQRHARATQVRVALETTPGKLLLRVEDNGRGGAIVPGNGLSGMRERLATIDAQLSVESQRGAGTKLTVHLPIPATNNLAATATQRHQI
jgi:two-component system, NarL family, sensor histidine kinase DesK